MYTYCFMAKVLIHARVDEEVLQVLRRTARDQDRTLSFLIAKILQAAMKGDKGERKQ